MLLLLLLLLLLLGLLLAVVGALGLDVSEAGTAMVPRRNFKAF